MTDFQPGFWQELSNTLDRPIIGLSPMDGVTDQPFRHIQKKYGQPDVVYTEFTSVEGLSHGATRLLKDFLFDDTQRPVVAQIYGTTPDFFRQAAIILCQLGFDGIDINMGCPAKNVAHSGAGAALIDTPQLAQEIVRQTKAGVRDWQNGQTVDDCANITAPIRLEVNHRAQKLPAAYQDRTRAVPVTVKTRVGFAHKNVTEWTKYLLEVEPVVIAYHGRTLKQQYGGSADWTEIARAAELIAPTPTLVLGNGDVKSHAGALHQAQTFGVDGVLIGRASFGNPLVFRPETDPLHQTWNRFATALEHAQLFETTYQDDEKYNFLPMRKHLGWYAKDIEGAKQLRIQLFKTENAAEVKALLQELQLL